MHSAFACNSDLLCFGLLNGNSGISAVCLPAVLPFTSESENLSFKTKENVNTHKKIKENPHMYPRRKDVAFISTQ